MRSFLVLLVTALAVLLAIACAGEQAEPTTGVPAPDDATASPDPSPKPTPSPTPAPVAGDAPTPLSGSRETDREALIAIFEALDGEDWRKKTNWLSDKPIGEWYGVTSDDEGRVIGLEFGEWVRRYSLADSEYSAYYNDFTGETYLTNGLRGGLPPEIGHFTALTSLDLRSESLWGEMPRELGNLKSLESLDLSGNGLAGNIPAELGNLPSLTNLNLKANNLRGQIPAELGNLSGLNYLYLSHNHLHGEIPRELANLDSLVVLELQENRLGSNLILTGCLPVELHRRLNMPYSDIGHLRSC